jgi:type 1 glutamine amidotransferase
MKRYFATFAAVLALGISGQAAPRKALIIDGQNNHDWKATTPVLKKLLEESTLFTVDVATAPPKGGDMSAFKPDFAGYAVVVLNYNGDSWSDETKAAFEKYVSAGGGVVSYHAADNAFPEWRQFNEMIAVGGWGGRKPDFGKAARFRDGKLELGTPARNCGNHGQRLPFLVTARDPRNPVMKGLPATWMHAGDELYDTLCGPAQNVDVLATAHSEPGNRGSGHDEPMLMVIKYGKGRVFHTTLGHDVPAMQCAGFITTFLRGTEWAATGKVTQKVPNDFPGPDKPSLRQ